MSWQKLPMKTTSPKLSIIARLRASCSCTKPNNGLLLQSRLYNTYGGTCRAHAESKLYRDLIQRELSELEGVPNLWLTEKYCGNKHDIYIRKAYGFGGYSDLQHPDFNVEKTLRLTKAN